MSSPRRTAGQGTEAFPSFEDDQEQTTTSYTTSTTTQTVIGGDADPDIRTTTTAAHPSGRGPAITHTTDDPNTAPIPFTQTTVNVPAQRPPPQYTVPRQRPISIRRLPSASNTRALASGSEDGTPSRSGSARRRAASAPQEPHLASSGGRLTRQSTRDNRQSGLTPLQEESTQPQQTTETVTGLAVPPPAASSSGVGRRRSLSNAARSFVSKLSTEDSVQHDDYENEVVDLLDVIGMFKYCQTTVR